MSSEESETESRSPARGSATTQEDRVQENDALLEESADDGDDEIIGVAFRRSLALIFGLGGLVAIAVLLFSREPETPPEQGLEAVAPRGLEVPSEEAPALPFTDITQAAGIDFVHRNGARGEKLLPETMGGGVAFFDHDADEDPDLLFVSSSDWEPSPSSPQPSSLSLYINDGHGAFEDRTADFGLQQTFYGMGVAVGDYDGDGDLDLYVTTLGRNRLFRRDADGYVDVTAEAGVAGDADAWSTGTAFVDIDGDHDLDLFVCNYVRWSPEIDAALDFRLDGIGKAYGPPQDYQGVQLYLFRNDGDGRFSDVSAESGIQVFSPTGEPMAKALAVLPTDADGDGFVDLLVANDTVRNFFFRNLGDGTFEEVGELYGLAYDRNGQATGAMGVDAAYHRGDENLAFAVGNFANEMSSIYVSQDDPSFYVDEAIAEGLGAASRRQLTFGMLFFDADLDGREDLLQVNGHIEDRIAGVDSSQTYEQPGQIFWNAGERGFIEAPSLGDLSRPIVGRGAASADIDGDGDLDLAVAQNGAAALLLRNDQDAGHHWLKLRLIGEAPNTAALGARVEILSGDRIQRLEVRPSRSYLAQVDPVLTVGLGDDAAAAEVRIRWPTGREAVLYDLPGNRVHRISEAEY